MHRRQKTGFSLIELLVVISIIVLLIGILVPVLARARVTANMMKEGTNERNIHVASAVYGSGNKEWFPGLDSTGRYAFGNGAKRDFLGRYFSASSNADSSATTAIQSVDATNNYAQAVMMEEGATNPAQWISPGESSTTSSAGLIEMTIATPNTSGSVPTAIASLTAADGLVTNLNNSYALLAYGASTLKMEWKSNQNNQSLVLGTRVIFGANGAGDGTTFNTLWTEAGSGNFRGSFVRGDSSTSSDTFDKTDCATSFSLLRYGTVTGRESAAAGTVNVGPYVKTALGNGQGTVASGDTYSGDSPGTFGAVAASDGIFQGGMLGSGNN